MKKKVFVIACLFSIFVHSQDRWKLDAFHSSIQFSVDHLVISEVTGSFNSFDGSLKMSNRKIETAKIKGEVNVSSIDTKNDQRDAHLKAPDFLDVTKYPKISFESTKITKKEGDQYQMKGHLTIKGKTKEVIFDVTYKGTAVFMGHIKTGIKAITEIDRTAFGLNYNSLLETGGAVVGKKVRITLNFEFTKT